LHEAFLKGAAAAIVSEGKYKNFPLIIVQDTLKALHDMASYYIRNILVDAKVIAIYFFITFACLFVCLFVFNYLLLQLTLDFMLCVSIMYLCISVAVLGL
jgi:hypothetical protein